MIATWMVYCSLCALGLSFAAVLAERSLLAGRGAVRGVWVGAVAGTIQVSAARAGDEPHIGVRVVMPFRTTTAA